MLYDNVAEYVRYAGNFGLIASDLILSCLFLTTRDGPIAIAAGHYSKPDM